MSWKKNVHQANGAMYYVAIMQKPMLLWSSDNYVIDICFLQRLFSTLKKGLWTRNVCGKKTILTLLDDYYLKYQLNLFSKTLLLQRQCITPFCVFFSTRLVTYFSKISREFWFWSLHEFHVLSTWTPTYRPLPSPSPRPRPLLNVAIGGKTLTWRGS